MAKSQFAPFEPPRRADWRERLAEMEALARAVARGVPPGRGDATAYLEARGDLIDSDVSHLLPGFLIQCHSIFRLRDFLTLYDPETALRETFMVRAFERCRAAIASARPGSAGEPETGPAASQGWMT